MEPQSGTIITDCQPAGHQPTLIFQCCAVSAPQLFPHQQSMCGVPPPSICFFSPQFFLPSRKYVRCPPSKNTFFFAVSPPCSSEPLPHSALSWNLSWKYGKFHLVSSAVSLTQLVSPSVALPAEPVCVFILVLILFCHVLQNNCLWCFRGFCLFSFILFCSLPPNGSQKGFTGFEFGLHHWENFNCFKVEDLSFLN